MAGKAKNTLTKDTEVETSTSVDIVKQEDAEKKNKPVVNKEYKDSDYISVKAVRTNVGYIDPNTYDVHRWNSSNPINDVTYATLNSMFRTNRKYLSNLIVMIEDDVIVEKFKLTNLYEKYKEFTTDDGWDIAKVKRFEKVYRTSEKEIKKSLREKIIFLVVNRKINDVSVIEMLQHCLSGNVAKINLLDMR